MVIEQGSINIGHQLSIDASGQKRALLRRRKQKIDRDRSIPRDI
jgi:hypothetical protein